MQVPLAMGFGQGTDGDEEAGAARTGPFIEGDAVGLGPGREEQGQIATGGPLGELAGPVATHQLHARVPGQLAADPGVGAAEHAEADRQVEQLHLLEDALEILVALVGGEVAGQEHHQLRAGGGRQGHHRRVRRGLDHGRGRQVREYGS